MKEKLAEAAAMDAEREAKIRKERDDEDEDEDENDEVRCKLPTRKRSCSASSLVIESKPQPLTSKKISGDNDKTLVKKHPIIDLCNDLSSDDSNDSKGSATSFRVCV